MKTKCLIVDDEPLAREVIASHVKQIPQLEVVQSCGNAMEAFEYLKSAPVDLIFLDIQMPVLTGIEFLKSLSNPPKVIFTTAYRDYAVDSYELDVIDYLLKPIPFERFFKATNKYFQARDAVTQAPAAAPIPTVPSKDYIYVNANKKNVKVRFEDILYVESIKDYIKIHTVGQKVVVKQTLSAFEAELPSPQFLRIHRSFIVSRSHVTAFTAKDVELGDTELPIGVSYKQVVVRALQ